MRHLYCIQPSLLVCYLVATLICVWNVLYIIRNIINVADAGACAVRVNEIPTVVDAIGGRQLLRLQGTRMGLNFMITSRMVTLQYPIFRVLLARLKQCSVAAYT
jgi:hypothetical protein